MADVLVVLTVFVFFGLCVALVWGCDKIIGPDDDQTVDATSGGLPVEDGLPVEKVGQ
jgi:hypothetical protein